jgi:hypothetical protein
LRIEARLQGALLRLAIVGEVAVGQYGKSKRIARYEGARHAQAHGPLHAWISREHPCGQSLYLCRVGVVFGIVGVADRRPLGGALVDALVIDRDVELIAAEV